MRWICLLAVEFILGPVLYVGSNVVTDAFIFFGVADDMVMIPGLPGKRNVVLASEFGHTDFVTTNDGRQIFGLRPELVLGFGWGLFFRL
jgi:hypothetical protein